MNENELSHSHTKGQFEKIYKTCYYLLVINITCKN